MKAALLFLVMSLLAGAALSQSTALTETRYCGAPRRDANGSILRRADVLAVPPRERG